ncbi:MAG: zf-HC2 domain-containing protein [Verrucomicrobiota bacterium]
MGCTEFQEQLSDFQDGTLPADAAAELSSHLRACGDCAEVARTLEGLRDHLRSLPPLPAPPELLPRIREAIAREAAAAAPAAPGPPGTTVSSRLKAPLQAAAVLLLVASAYWYQYGAVAPVVRKGPATPQGAVSSEAGPGAARVAPPAAKAAPSRNARTAAAPERTAERRGISTLPPDTPEPKVRVWSRADLPAAPALLAGTDAERIVPGFPAGGSVTDPGLATTPSADSRRLARTDNAREVTLGIAREDRDGAVERVMDTARSLGGSVVGAEVSEPDGNVTIRILLPKPATPTFLETLSRIGTIPPEELASKGALPAGQETGTVAYTVSLRPR